MREATSLLFWRLARYTEFDDLRLTHVNRIPTDTSAFPAPGLTPFGCKRCSIG